MKRECKYIMNEDDITCIGDIRTAREALRPKYEQFIQTERGKEWQNSWRKRTGSQYDGDFCDYLYDFYPEMLQMRRKKTENI